MAGYAAPPEELVVGMELSYPPFEMSDPNGQPAGLSVDLARELGTSLGRPIVIQNIAFDGLIPALKTGKIELIISSMTATAERRRSIDFSVPYLQTGLSLLVKKDSPIRKMADVDQPGTSIAVKRGTTGHGYAAAHLKLAKLLVLDRESAAVLEVVQGKADAFIYDQLSVFMHWRRNQGTTRALLEPVERESWAIGIRLGNEALKARVNGFLEDFRSRGGFQRLGERYLKEQKEGFEQLGYPFVF